MSKRAPLAENPFDAVTSAPQPRKAAAPVRIAPAPAANTTATTPGSAAAHRVGTIATPYTRRDGVAVRQWSCTLPVDVIDALQLAALQSRRRPADIVAELIAAHCGLQPTAAAPAPAKPAKPKRKAKK